MKGLFPALPLGLDTPGIWCKILGQRQVLGGERKKIWRRCRWTRHIRWWGRIQIWNQLKKFEFKGLITSSSPFRMFFIRSRRLALTSINWKLDKTVYLFLLHSESPSPPISLHRSLDLSLLKISPASTQFIQVGIARFFLIVCNMISLLWNI